MNKKMLLVFFGLSTFLSFAQNPEDYAKTITEKELKEMLYVYASDEFEGRDTGKEGQKKAVHFLKDYYKTHKIQGAKGLDDYFQKVPLFSLKQGAKGYAKIGNRVLKSQKDLIVPFGGGGAKFSSDNFVYLGYGIDDENYSDYDKIDVKGKIVLIRNGGEPKNRKGIYEVTSSKEPSKWSGEQGDWLKLEAATKHGVKAIFYEDNEGFEELKAMDNLHETFVFEHELDSDNEKKNQDLMIFLIKSKTAKSIYPKISKSYKPKLIKKTIKIDLEKEKDSVDTENVVAMIKGSEFPDEYLVISAHLDHLGVDKKGNVFNGADDDGSGTIAVLEIAEAFQEAVKQGYRPKRTVVFLHVTGEEKGLLGSKWYSDHPIFPMAQTIADLNIDMIGRIDPKRKGNRNYVYLIGSDKLSTDLHNISEQVNKKCCNIELDYTYNDDNDPNRFYYRSDHYNFAKHNVPIIFYFNGVHKDYHQITDTVDKINYDLLKNRTELVFYTAWELANRDKRPVVDKAGN